MFDLDTQKKGKTGFHTKTISDISAIKYFAVVLTDQSTHVKSGHFQDFCFLVLSQLQLTLRGPLANISISWQYFREKFDFFDHFLTPLNSWKQPSIEENKL